MWWIVALAVVALGLLAHIHAQDRREKLVAAVLDALAETELNQVQPTGDEVAVLVADRLGRRVGIAEVYDALVALRDAGLVVSEYQRLPTEYGRRGLRDQLPAVWRLADKGGRVMAACRLEIINQGHAIVPRSCAICGLGRCTKGLPDPYKLQAQETPGQPQANFKVGDVVRLRSGGPQMTVATGVTNLMRLGGTDRVLCVWTDENGGYHEEQIPTSALRPS